jgi:hypothetical protein
MNHHRFSTIISALILLTAGCFCVRDKDKMLLELKDIQNFQVIERGERNELQISGLAFHSAFAVEEITTERQGHDMVIEVHLVRARDGLTGSFNHTVPVPADVNRVLFGKDRKEIWRRP